MHSSWRRLRHWSILEVLAHVARRSLHHLRCPFAHPTQVVAREVLPAALPSRHPTALSRSRHGAALQVLLLLQQCSAPPASQPSDHPALAVVAGGRPLHALAAARAAAAPADSRCSTPRCLRHWPRQQTSHSDLSAGLCVPRHAPLLWLVALVPHSSAVGMLAAAES